MNMITKDILNYEVNFLSANPTKWSNTQIIRR